MIPWNSMKKIEKSMKRVDMVSEDQILGAVENVAGQGASSAEERREATAGRSPSPTPSGATSAGRRSLLTRASRAGMASLED